MKIRTSLTLILLLLLLFTLGLTVGCRNEPDSVAAEHTPSPETSPTTGIREGYVLTPEFIRLPGEDISPGNFIYSGGRLYFTSRLVLDELSAIEEIFHIDIGGTNLTHLAGYAVELPAPGVHGSTWISDLYVNDDGTI